VHCERQMLATAMLRASVRRQLLHGLRSAFAVRRCILPTLRGGLAASRTSARIVCCSSVSSSPDGSDGERPPSKPSIRLRSIVDNPSSFRKRSCSGWRRAHAGRSMAAAEYDGRLRELYVTHLIDASNRERPLGIRAPEKDRHWLTAYSQEGCVERVCPVLQIFRTLHLLVQLAPGGSLYVQAGLGRGEELVR
jgi:hypothetical protein